MHKLGLIRGQQQDALPDRPIRVLGIDLGTTNSTVSQILWDPAVPQEIKAKCGDLEQETLQGTFSHALVPSIVALQGNRVLIGEGAKRLRGQGLRKDQGIFYECKNDIGLNKTYHRAPDGFRSAAEIGGKVLAFLHDAALRHSDQPVQRTVVTVPASFQANQRQDTVRAAQLAGLDLAGGELLDEPVAAFIDYLMMKGAELIEELSTPKNLVVFDFGGGTCDVAVFRLEVLPQGGLQVSTLAVSRYHRLGGGDIDAAIVHEVLVPQLREQNRMTEFELGFTEKKMAVEPALLGVAEQLKIGLCEEIRRLQAFGKYDDEDKNQISKTAPGSHRVTIDRRQLDLNSPRITAAQFESLLEPFLDQDFLFARETEYRMTCSVFAPLQDAIDRSGVGERNVDLCLLVGGSSLIPQVVEAIDQFFPRARLLTYPDRDSVKACISRGAAYQALSLAFQGRGLVQQVCHDDIAIRTGEGLVTLVPRGVALPYPGVEENHTPAQVASEEPSLTLRVTSEDPSLARRASIAGVTYAVCKALGVPKALKTRENCELRVELVAASEGRTLYTEVWAIKGPAAAGAPLTLQYRLDENHVLELVLARADGGKSPPLKQVIDRPLSNVVNPGSKQLEILEIEENLKTAGWPTERMVREMTKLADLYAELNQTEKAISTLQAAQRLTRRADADLLNKIGIFYGELGDFEREERFLREAGEACRGDAPWFNLALSKHRQKRTEEAIEALEKALARAETGPSYVLRALLACEEGDEASERRFLQEAMSRFHPPRILSDWALGWCLTGARLIGDRTLTDAAKQEIERRHRGGGVDAAEGILPLKIAASEASCS